MYIFIYKVVFHFNKFLMVEFNVLVVYEYVIVYVVVVVFCARVCMYVTMYVCMYVYISKFHSI